MKRVMMMLLVATFALGSLAGCQKEYVKKECGTGCVKVCCGAK